MNKRRIRTFWDKAGRQLDGMIRAVSPKMAYNRRRYRFAYNILDGSRLRTKRSGAKQGGDQELSERNLDRLREIHRDLATNNPLVKGIFRKLATSIVGTSTRIEAKSEDDGWNRAAEQAVKAEMIDEPFDVTQRFNFHSFIKKCYYRYALDGDCFTIFTSEGPQAKQGECCGTPYGKQSAKLQPVNFTINNGVAVSKRTGRVVGYYIGTPNKWGYIKAESYKKYPAEVVHHLVNFERFDHSRGEPMLTPAVEWVDYLFEYAKAEVVAAKVNACFPVTALTNEPNSMTGSTGFIKTAGGTDQKDEYDRPLVRMEPGQIWEGEPGESLNAVGAARPAPAFDNFFMRMLTIIGSPVCLPLMLISGDFSGATFMNSRFAYNEARDFWQDEQQLVMVPLIRRLWLWKIRELIDSGELTERKDWANHKIYCKRWPYIDPYKEAMADKVSLANGVMTRTEIVARQNGTEWKDLIELRAQEEELIKEKGIALAPQKSTGPGSN